MEITFSAANTVGLNNPGTEIITLVKDGSGNFINPPSYDKMRAYLRSGEVPMLFVTAEGGETGSLYQLVEYSETENKIRFSNDANAIEFSAGGEAPVVSDVGGGGGGSSDAVLYTAQTLTDEQKKQARDNIDAAIADFVVNVTLNSDSTVTPDKTFAQIQAAIQEGKQPVVKLSASGMTVALMPLVYPSTEVAVFAAVADVSEGTITTVTVQIKADGASFYRIAAPTLNSEVFMTQYPMESDPVSPMEIATKRYVDNKECILKSTTPGSTKKFKITVDDTGTLSTTEVT